MIERRSMLSLLALAALASVAAAAPGCGPSRFRVVREASGNPLRRARRFALEPLHFQDVVIGGKNEPLYMADKEEPLQVGWLESKQAANDAYLLALQSGANELWYREAPAPDARWFVVRTRVVSCAPCFVSAPPSGPATMSLTTQIVGAEGAVVEEIAFEVRDEGRGPAATSRDRLTAAAREAGAVVARYLRARTGW